MKIRDSNDKQFQYKGINDHDFKEIEKQFSFFDDEY